MPGLKLEFDFDLINKRNAEEAKNYYLGREIRWRQQPQPRGVIVEIDPARGIFSARYRVKWHEGFSKGETSGWLGSYDLLLEQP